MNSSMFPGDIIQILAGGTNIRSVINTAFSPTVKFYALRDNGKTTLWGNIVDEYVGNVRDHLEYYEFDSTQEYLRQCIKVLPKVVDYFISVTESDYFEHLQIKKLPVMLKNSTN